MQLAESADISANAVVNGLLCAVVGALVAMALLGSSETAQGSTPKKKNVVQLLEGQRAVTLPDGDRHVMPTTSQVMALIKHRRSIFPKDYNGTRQSELPKEVLEHMLEAANWAPTHGLTEPWRFVVLHGAKAIGELNALKMRHARDTMADEQFSAALPKLEAKERHLLSCAACIVICLKRVTNKKGKLMPEWEEIASIGAAVQNMHLVLAGYGFGGYWSSGGCAVPGEGWGASLEARTLFGMDDEGDRVLGVFHVGVSDKYELLTEKYARVPKPWDEKVIWQ